MNYVQTRTPDNLSNYWAIFNVDLKKIASLYKRADRINTETTDLLKEIHYSGLTDLMNLCDQLNMKIGELNNNERKFVKTFYVRKIEGDGGKDKYEIYRKNTDPY